MIFLLVCSAQVVPASDHFVRILLWHLPETLLHPGLNESYHLKEMGMAEQSFIVVTEKFSCEVARNKYSVVVLSVKIQGTGRWARVRRRTLDKNYLTLAPLNCIKAHDDPGNGIV